MNDYSTYEIGESVDRKMAALLNRAVTKYDRRLCEDLYYWIGLRNDDSFRKFEFKIRAQDSGFPRHFGSLIESIVALKEAREEGELSSKNWGLYG